jgi:hypothetical protein
MYRYLCFIAQSRYQLPMPFEPIENYGVIGNMQSIALVGMNGSIDFLCYPDLSGKGLARR